jgi:hypothetical protein
MECLKDFIGLRWAKGEEPVSGLYVNDLQGISIKSLDKIANDEQVTFFEVWESVQRRALQRFTTDVQNRFSTRYNLRRITENTSWQKQVETLNFQTPASAEYRGFDIQMGVPQLQITNFQGWVSPMQVINVQTLYIYLKADATIPLRFFAIVNGFASLVYSKDVVGITGWNEVQINRDFYDVMHLFVSYDATDIDSVYLPLDWTYDYFYSSVFITVWDASSRVMACKASNKNDAGNLTYLNNTYGIVGIVSVRCKYEGIICKNKSVISTALWYLMGVELLNERLYSDRINRYTTIDIEKAKQLKAEFEERYYVELQMALDGINIQVSDPCIDCNGQVILADSLP